VSGFKPAKDRFTFLIGGNAKECQVGTSLDVSMKEYKGAEGVHQLPFPFDLA
jgi:hypothetical protein